MSNAAIIVMLWIVLDACVVYGTAQVIKYYVMPWLMVTHWCKYLSPHTICVLTDYHAVIMITYLHHTDPILPHYRGIEWNFQRGAAATIDRDFLGWQGRFFLHDVAHYHVIHHVCFVLRFIA